jgi:hypothetical protein
MKVIKVGRVYMLVDNNGNTVSKMEEPSEERLKEIALEAEERRKKLAEQKTYRDRFKN